MQVVVVNDDKKAEKPWKNYQTNKKQSKETKKHSTGSWFSKWPYFFKALTYIILGDIVIMTPGLVSYMYYIDDRSLPLKDWRNSNGEMAIDGIPVFNICVYLSVVWTFYFVFRWFFRVLPEIIEQIGELFFGISGMSQGMSRATRLSKFLNYLRVLKVQFGILAWSIFSTNFWRKVVSVEEGWKTAVELLLKAFLVVVCAWILERILIHIFTIRFHTESYENRIKVNKSNLMILQQLSKAVDEKSQETHIARKVEKASLGIVKIFEAALGIEPKPSTGLMLSSKEDANELAKLIWESICPENRDYLVSKDFYPFFDSENEAIQSFGAIDRNKNGDINKDEFFCAVKTIFSNKMYIERSLIQGNQAIDKLDTLLKVVFAIIGLFILIDIFEKAQERLMVAAVSVYGGLLFAFSATIRDLFESIIFLFIKHPYDIGDVIMVGDEKYTVKEFGLTSTVLIHDDGFEVYSPNSKLSSQMIYNIRRSGGLEEKITLVVELSTTSAQISQLRDHLLKYMELNSRDLEPKLEIRIKEIIDRKSMVLKIPLKYKFNWQDGSRKGKTRGNFMVELKNAIEKYDIPVVDKNQLSVQMSQ